jgi:hypothetical protein
MTNLIYVVRICYELQHVGFSDGRETREATEQHNLVDVLQQ